MKDVFNSLRERDRRLYAAIEADKLPHGGVRYLSQLFGCTPKTIYQGLKELSKPLSIGSERNRKEGGGRKKTIDKLKGLQIAFVEVLKEHTAGDPMNEKVIWTDLTLNEIADHLLKKGFKIGRYVVKQLLQNNGYVRRKASKSERIGNSENRNEQFENIKRLKQEYQDADNPVISIDTKKKSFWVISTETENYILKNA